MYGDVTNFLNDYGGLWTFVSLPLVAIATAAAVVQLVPWLRTTVRDDARNMSNLRKQVRRLRIELDLEPRLVLGALLPVRVRHRPSAQLRSPAELYDSLGDGAQVFVVGGAGAGKSILALTLVKESLRRSEADPAQPLMEVISLRNWRKSIFKPAGADSLLDWMAVSLRDEYPMFGKRFFVELLRSQRLIPCLDGLDEVEEERRSPLLHSLRSYLAAGMPVIVLSRESDVPSLKPSGTDEPIRRFELHELLPLSTETVGQLVEEVRLEDLSRRSDQPHRLARLIGNPLVLSIVVRARRAGAFDDLEGVDDPEDEIWEAFFDSGLGKPDEGNRSSPRSRAGTVALLLHQAKQETFRVGDLYRARGGIWWTLAVLAAPLFAWGVPERAVGGSIYLVYNLGLTLVPWSRSWAARVSRRVFYRRPNMRDVMTVLLLTSGGLILAVGGGIAESAFRHILLEGETAAAWWSVFGRGHLDLNWSVLGVLMLLAASVGASSLDFTSRQTWEFFASSRIANLGFPLLGLALFAVGWPRSNPSLIFLGLLALTPWVFLGTSRLVLTLSGQIPGSGLRATCETMARAGILHAHKSKYRFRHREMSLRLAQEAVHRLAVRSELALVLDRKRPSFLIDARLLPGSVDGWECVVSEVSDLNRSDEDVLTLATLYWYYGKLRPAETVPWLRRYVHRYPASAVAVHLAEVLDSEGRWDEATEIWRRAVESNHWLLHKWIRREIVRGDVRGAQGELEKWVAKQPASKISLERLLLAELHCRFGSGPEKAAGLRELQHLCRVPEPYLARRASLEFARLRAEDLDSVGMAEEMLSSTLDEHGALDALRYARTAQLCLLDTRREEARQFGREAFALIHWTDDPTHQLEVFLTAAYATSELREEAFARVRALTGFGWCLRGRSSHWIDPDAPLGSELLALAYR
jgi:tetratricopeptide (TPR) repeat protein